MPQKNAQVIVVREKAAPPRKQRRSPRRQMTTIPRQVFGTAALHNHWSMIRDPCFATLAESAYRGRSGIVSRFTQVTTISTGLNTGLVAAFNPAACAGTLVQFTDPTIATAAIAYSYVLPGQAFLVANAESSRVIGFCLDIDYIGTELNRAGMIYGGVCLGDTVPAGVGLIPDNLKQLLPNQTRTPDRQISQLWFPGVANEDYGNVGVTSTAFTGQHNVTCLVAEGLPAGVQLRLRLTTVVEWLPLLGVGVAMPSPVSGTNPVGAYEKLHEMACATTDFTHSFAQGAQGAANRFARTAGEVATRAVVVGAMGMARRAANRRNNPNYGNVQRLVG